MTALLTRAAPSPVPLTERAKPRDVSGNVWVQTPEPQELSRLFGELDWQHAADLTEVLARRRPSPGRHSG